MFIAFTKQAVPVSPTNTPTNANAEITTVSHNCVRKQSVFPSPPFRCKKRAKERFIITFPLFINVILSVFFYVGMPVSF